MADAVTSQTVMDNKFDAIMVFTNISDGTGEAGVTKVDVSALAGSPARVAIKKVQYCLSGMAVNILEDATTDVVLLALGLTDSAIGVIDFEPSALRITEAAGATGDLLFTTVGHTAADRYTIVLHLQKIYLNE